MTRRQLVCTCEDVTEHDIQQAIRAGHRDMESVKRFTGLATGLCQGRSCLVKLAQILSAQEDLNDTLRPTTARPPLVPTPLGVIATNGELPPVFPSPGAPPNGPMSRVPASPRQQAPLPRQAQMVIIGGGILGLATAYHVTRCGIRDVVVLERSYLTAGASGRNGGGIREQFSTEGNVLLMRESVRLCRRFAKQLGINVWFRQGGYLFLARSEAHMAALEQNAALHNRLGVPTRLLTRKATGQLLPLLHLDDIAGAAFNGEDGVMFPWPFLWGYADRARAQGAHIATFTPATKLLVQAGRVVGVVTPRGTIRCDLVVNAAGAWSPQVAQMAGVQLPNQPERHEILVTTSLKPAFAPLVSEIGSGLYFSQSMRGEIVGGLGDPEQPAGVETRSSLRFLMRMARALVHRIPSLASVQVLRQWAGCYDVTPDGNPIVGEVDAVKGFFQLNGFMGHGFMMAPAACRIVGEFLAQGRSHRFVDENRPSRFREGAPTTRETMIIG